MPRFDSVTAPGGITGNTEVAIRRRRRAVDAGPPPCFVAGTRILTARGEVAVEHLRAGDALVLADGQTAPLVWLGHRRIDLRRHAHRDRDLPVLIEAGAIADGMPRRDLMLSPDHALYLEGHLIPAKVLINGVTIRQVALDAVMYYHVELPVHAVVQAEGVPAESLRKTPTRAGFDNADGPLVLHPAFAPTRREMEGCAPVAVSGRIVERVRRRLLARTGIITTSDPRLVIRRRADGAAIIESRSAIPGHITHDPRDCRRLGIKVATLTIDGATLPLGHTALTKGWHKPEADGRWTDGAGVIPASLLSDSSEIAVTLAATLAYPLVGSAAQPRHSAR
ncbi:Hint domain-containing protein [Acidiphilium sp. PA]|nr:Hint domain-containing protein [Acidiphilium sp. PA]